MVNLMYEDTEFKILKGKNYVLVRKNMPYKFHSHFDKLEGAKTIMDLFYKGIKPHSTYFHEAMRRVCTEEEFKVMREERLKPKYRNIRR